VVDNAPSTVAALDVGADRHQDDLAWDEAAGFPPVTAVAAVLLKSLGAVRHPLAAELILASVFGTVARSSLPDLDENRHLGATTALLSGLIEYCERLAEGRDARAARDFAARSTASQDVAMFADITEQQALNELRVALAEPPCPEQPDQIRDIGIHLYLTHSRAQHLARLLGEPEVQLFADSLDSELPPGSPGVDHPVRSVPDALR
jgi:hypothetical protein